MKKTFSALLQLSLILTSSAESLDNSVAADFGFDFAGVLSGKSGQTPTLEFRLWTTNRTDFPVWGRRLPVAIDTNGTFKVRLADASGQPVASLITNLAEAVVRTATDRLRLAVSDGTGSFAVDLPPVACAGVADLALRATGDFNAACGIVASDLATTEAAADRVIANSLVSKAAVKAFGAADIAGGLVVKGDLRCQGAVAASNQITVCAGVEIEHDVEAKDRFDVKAISDVKTLAVKNRLSVGGINAAVPPGTIVAWNDSSSVPDGWAVCNGDDGTPDLRGRFVVGWSSSRVPGDKSTGYGGSDTVQISADEMPSHDHVLPYYSGMISGKRDRSHEVRGVSDVYDTEGSRLTNESCGPSSGGGNLGDAHENRPPYYALVFIMKKYGGSK